MPITERDIWNSSPDRPIVTGGSSGGSSSGPWGMGSPATASGPSYSNPVANPGMSNPVVAHNPPAQPQVDYNKMLQEALARQQAQQQAQLQQQQAAAEAARRQAEQAAAQKKQQYVDTQTGLYNNYFDTQKNSQFAALKNARDTALQGFNGAERVANQTAYTNKNQVDASHAQSAQRLRELMASQGLLSSGDNVTQNLQLENQRASALNDINQSTGNILQDVTEKRNMVSNQAASQEQALADRISSDKTAALIDLQKYGDQKETDLNKFNYQQYVDAINNQFRQQQADISNELSASQLVGQYRGQDTLQAATANRDYGLKQAMFNSDQTQRGSDNEYRQAQLALQAQQWDRNFGMQNKQANWNAYKDYVDWTDNLGTGPKENWKFLNDDANSGPITSRGQQNEWERGFKETEAGRRTTEFAQKMGYDWAQLDIETKKAFAQISSQNANTQISRDKLNWDKDPGNPSNQPKLSSGSANKAVDDPSYSEFLTDLPRIASQSEGQALIDSYRADGVSEATLQKMIKSINSKFKG